MKNQMDLQEIPGIGPAYSQRLRAAGVEDVEALAAVPDVDALADWTGIPRARLETFLDAARRMRATRNAERRTPLDAVRGMLGSLRRAAATLRERAPHVVRDALRHFTARGRSA